jgi:hypothetical protein
VRTRLSACSERPQTVEAYFGNNYGMEQTRRDVYSADKRTNTVSLIYEFVNGLTGAMRLDQCTVLDEQNWTCEFPYVLPYKITTSIGGTVTTTNPLVHPISHFDWWLARRRWQAEHKS